MNFRPFEPKSTLESRITWYFFFAVIAVVIVAAVMSFTARNPAPQAPVVEIH